MRSTIKRFIKILLVAITIVIIWQLIILIFKTPAYLFPGPDKVFITMYDNFGKLWPNLLVTIFEILTGFLIANLLSISLAYYTFINRKAERFLIPFAVSAKTIPLIAIIPLVLIWFGSGIASKIFAVVLICFFPALISLIRGIRSISEDMLDLFDFYAKNKFQKIIHLVVPATSPYLFSALKISSSLAVIGALVSELIAANKGLGFVILTSYYTFNIPMVFCVVILTCLIGIVFYYSIQYFEHKIVFWTDPVD